MTENLLAYVEASLLEIFTDLNTGLDVAPGKALRLEGYMQAMIHADSASKGVLEALIAKVYEQVYGEAMPSLFPPFEDDSILPIPCYMQRAPVV